MPKTMKRGGPKKFTKSSLAWAIEQLEAMAEEETDPGMKAVWFRAKACGHERMKDVERSGRLKDQGSKA